MQPRPWRPTRWLISLLLLVAVWVPAAQASSPLRAFTSGSYWNVPLPAAAPIHPDSDRIIEFLKADNSNNGCLHLAGAGSNRWGTPVHYAGDGDRTYNVTTTKYKVPPEFSKLRIPAGAASGDNSDAEMVIYDAGRNTVALLSKAVYDAGSDRWTVSGGTIHYLDSNGLSANVEGGDPRNFTTFRGQNGYMHAVRYEEVASGQVSHIMRLAVNTAKAGEWLWPLNGTDGDSNNAYAPPQGTRLRIKPGVDLSRYNLHPEARVIARGLQTHGAMVTDSSGGSNVLKLEDTVRGGRGQLWGLSYNALCSIPLDAFEIIEPGYRPDPGTTAPEPGTDTGTSEPDTGTSEPDTATSEPDTGTVAAGSDTGTSDSDSGTSEPDTSTSDSDSGTSEPDTGTALDSSSPVLGQEGLLRASTLQSSAPGPVRLDGVASGANRTADSVTIPRPDGTNQGDVMLATVSLRGSPRITPPEGWRRIRLDDHGYVLRKAMYFKVAGSNEPTGYTWRFRTEQSAAGTILVYSGVDRHAPVLGHEGLVNARSNVLTAPSVGVDRKGAVLVVSFASAPDSTLEPSAGLRERSQAIAKNHYPVVSYVADAFTDGRGGTGVRGAVGQRRPFSIGHTVLLRPAS